MCPLPTLEPLFLAAGGRGHGYPRLSLIWEVEQVGNVEALLEMVGSLLP